jgi:cell division protein FtsL
VHPRPRRRARRGPHPAFLILTAIVVTALVAAAVSLSAMLVQASFDVGELETRVAELADRGAVLTTEVAELSSPSRVAKWADGRGMVMPDEVVALTIPAESRG